MVKQKIMMSLYMLLIASAASAATLTPGEPWPVLGGDNLAGEHATVATGPEPVAAVIAPATAAATVPVAAAIGTQHHEGGQNAHNVQKRNTNKSRHIHGPVSYNSYSSTRSPYSSGRPRKLA